MLVYLLAAAAAAVVNTPPNVLFITVDTLRADRCSSYGYARPTTPNFERLAREGTQFDTAYAPMSTTSPSHATMFTGLYPITHGVLKNGIPLDAAHRTLAEILLDQKYQTAAVTSSAVFSSRIALDQGFERFDNDVLKDGTYVEEGIHHGTERLATLTTDLSIAWLKGRAAGKPFFLWTHYFSPHFPYAPPEAQRQRFAAAKGAEEAARRSGLYDGEVAYADQEIGRLLDWLEQARLGDDTLVVLVGDHGESITQHGILTHGATPYEEQVLVPLLFRWRGRIHAGKRASAPVELIDVMPTILELLRVAEMPPTQGRSLRPILIEDAKGDPERTVFLQRRSFDYRPDGRLIDERFLEPGVYPLGPSFGVRSGKWKLIDVPEEKIHALYDLSQDPGETRNVAADFKDKARELELALVQWREKYDRAHRKAPIPGDEAERLRGLGYIR
jgi:choline-sulfatase